MRAEITSPDLSNVIYERENLTSRVFIGLPAERKSYDEIIDLFARGTSSAEVLAFQPSAETQQRGA